MDFFEVAATYQETSKQVKAAELKVEITSFTTDPEAKLCLTLPEALLYKTICTLGYDSSSRECLGPELQPLPPAMPLATNIDPGAPGFSRLCMSGFATSSYTFTVPYREEYDGLLRYEEYADEVVLTQGLLWIWNVPRLEALTEEEVHELQRQLREDLEAIDQGVDAVLRILYPSQEEPDAREPSSRLQSAYLSALKAMLLRSVSHPALHGLKRYVQEYLDGLPSDPTADLPQRFPAEMRLALRRPSLVFPQDLGNARSARFLGAEEKSSVFIALSALIDRLGAIAANPVVDLHLACDPARSTFVFWPRALKNEAAGVRCEDGVIENLWIGKYDYRVESVGYRTIDALLNLVDNPGQWLACELEPAGGSGRVLPCRQQALSRD